MALGQLARRRWCSFCGQPRRGAWVINGPGVGICDDCVSRAEVTVADERAAGRIGTQPCSFCGNTGRAEYGHMVIRICDECIALCREILDEGRPPHPLPSARTVTERKRR